MNLFYRRDGTPYPEGEKGLMQWAKDFNDRALKRVANDVLPNKMRVSTVWLGLDHGFGGKRPLIFESMVFKDSDSYRDIDMARYATEEEAQAGHERLVKKYSQET